MPLEPSKPPAHSAFEPPPDLLSPPRSAGAKAAAADSTSGPPLLELGPRIRGANAAPPKSNRTTLIVGGSLALIVIVFIGWRIFRTENKATGRGAKLDLTTITLQPNQPKVENLEVTGIVSYTFEVNPVDADILGGVVQRGPRDPMTTAVLKKLPDPLETLRKGERRSLTGELKAGQYSWVLINEGKKPARVRVKFIAQ